ncbi:MAG TPA: ATP-binding cassette domain-containing protein [Caproiciproducens sp.]|nr:ATP-binding cassette domain-containing protein [Caproiciproducens sp.]
MSTQLKSESGHGFVSLQHVYKTFNPGSVNEVVLFTDFSMEIDQNQFVSVVGSNGSGKTTVLNLLCGSIPVDDGEIFVNGRNIGRLKEHERSKFIGRVFQDPSKGTCPELTILENMALADNKGASFGLNLGVNRKRVDYYRSQLELLKLGLEDKIQLPVASLSGGQRQALALLICTMTPLDLLILDEHTAALDPRSSETVMELTERIVREKKLTTLMVTHNLKFAVNYGDRLIMMHRGTIVLDAEGEGKLVLHTKDLTEKFNEISIEDGN